MARARRLAWGLAVLLVPAAARAQALGGHPGHPHPLAQSLPEGAKRDYDAGRLLFEDGDFATALLKYQAAYDATHDARLLWDVAACQKDLRRYARALATLARYLAEGGDLLTAADRRDARELSRAIAPFTASEQVRVSEGGAEVWVDGERAGTSPLPGPIVLDIGTRHVRVKKDGYRPWERDVPVGGSAPTTIDAALEKQGGHLDLHVPAGAAVRVDDGDVGRGPSLSLDLGVGPHAVRVAAPKMRPLVIDVVVEDGKSRSLDMRLEPESAPSSEVRVTVGCANPDEPLPQDDLAVFFDDATESALPLGVRMRREPGRDVIAYVAYRVAPGRHTVHVAALGCESRDTVIDAPEGGFASVRGALPPSDSWFEATPAGSHDGWRLSAGLLESSPQYAQKDVTLFGGSVVTGYEGRWLTGLLDGRYQVGRVADTTLSQWTIGARPGIRVPLYLAALTAGVGLHFGQYYASQGASSTSGVLVSGSVWGAVDIQPFCEWGLELGAAMSGDGYGGISVPWTTPASFWLHVAYSPNRACMRRRAGLLRIEGSR